MRFAHPVWIIIGIIICTSLLLLNQLLERRRQTTLQRFAATHMLPQLTRHISWPRRRVKCILFILSILLCFIAIARPQYGSNWIEVKQKGIDILFALDTSKSMLAADSKPNRLERARFAIMDFVNQLGGDRVGLLPFAGSTFLICPLTLDYSAFEQTLADINTETIPQAGTNLAVVIAEAERILTASSNHKILILLTDGENLQGEALAAAREAGAKGLIIHTVAVGTHEGELVPADNGGFLKDSAGKFVTSRLDEKTLEEIAKATGGISVPLGDRGQGLETIYRQKLNLIPKDERGERRQKVPIERYSWPLALALLLLIVEFLLTERRNGGTPIHAFFKALRQRFFKNRHTSLLLLTFLLILTAPSVQPAIASPAEKSFARGDYAKASELYRKDLEKKPNDPRLNYNYGTVAYKNNLFDEAISSFTKALKTDDLDLQEKAYYNKANAHFRKGTETQEANSQRTIEEWQNALDAYSAALKLQPEDADAKYNHDLVTKKLAELKQRQQEKEQQKQEKDRTAADNKSEEKNQTGQNSPEKKQSPQSQAVEKTPNKNEQQQNGSNKENSQPATERNQQKDRAGIGQDQSAESQPADARQDRERRLQGKMTQDEAQRLLKSLKGEEKTLNFSPSADQEKDDQPERNW